MLFTREADVFEADVRDSTYFLLGFYTPWCGACKNVSPKWEAAMNNAFNWTNANDINPLWRGCAVARWVRVHDVASECPGSLVNLSCENASDAAHGYAAVKALFKRALMHGESCAKRPFREASTECVLTRALG
eukprot:m.799810 g.799810  ORF g.799810 m.799810 type:complete len:133 (-) comp23354_c2_seq5:176-574(-)